MRVSEAIDHLRFALGGAAPEGGSDLFYVNLAGNHLVSMKSWKYLDGGKEDLELVDGQDFVPLPKDFQAAKGVVFKEWGPFVWTTTQGILDWQHWAGINSSYPYFGRIIHGRDAGTSTREFRGFPADGESVRIGERVYKFQTTLTDEPGNLLIGATIAACVAALRDAVNASADQAGITYALSTPLHPRVKGNVSGSSFIATEKIGGNKIKVYDTISDGGSWTSSFLEGGDGPPRPQLDLYPTPDTSQSTNPLTFYYRRGWAKIGTDDLDIDLPEWLDLLFVEVLRAVVRGQHDDLEDFGATQRYLGIVKDGEVFKRASKRDNKVQPDFGTLRNGMAEVQSYAGGRGRSYPVVFNNPGVPQ